jgi:hypothetical protein
MKFAAPVLTLIPDEISAFGPIIKMARSDRDFSLFPSQVHSYRWYRRQQLTFLPRLCGCISEVRMDESANMRA